MRRALAVWDCFWFAPQSTSTLAVIRITFALVLLAWAVALGPDLLAFLSSNGILPRAPDYATAGQSGMWSLLGPAPGDAAVLAFYAVFVAAVICFLFGFHTRLSPRHVRAVPVRARAHVDEENAIDLGRNTSWLGVGQR